MASAPALSVIMSVYNGARYVYAATQSILAQDFADFEFLIVNDGSVDNSGDILRTLALSDNRIRLIERKNRGLVASLNEMVAAAKAPYLARMDSDDIAMPTRFSRQTAYMAAHPEVGILGTNTHDIDDRGRIVGPTTDYPAHPAMDPERLKHGPPVCHPSVMMRTDLIRQLGGYRPAFRHAEDYELWLRASSHCEIANLTERLMLYRRSEFQVSEVHNFEQATAAAVAWHNHVRQRDGKPDLFDGVTALPEFAEIDDFFGEVGVASAVRKMLVEQLRYSSGVLRGDAFALMIEQAGSGTGFKGAGRTIMRLARLGEFDRAFALARRLMLAF